MKKRQLPSIRLFMLVVLLFVAGCTSPTPIAVFVTPTPDTQLTPSSTPFPTVNPGEIVIMPAGATNTPVSAAPTATVQGQASPQPSVTFIGPIIGPEYTLPPTSTPRPSVTPTVGPSPTGTQRPPTTEPPDEEPTETPELPEPTALPNLDPERIGIQLDANLDRRDWDDAMFRLSRDDENDTGLGMAWVKVQVSWAALQPNGPDEYGTPFQQLEQYLQDADRQGLKIMVSVAKTPGWARSNQTEDGPPDDPQAYARFLTFLLSRFGNIVDAVEIWNEPNLQREWQGTLPFSGAGYMQLFRPAYDAVRAYSATMPIITAGLAPTGNNPGSIDDRDYLRQMYAAGLGNYGDVAIGAHPYSWANPPDSTCCGTRGWDDDPHFFFRDTMQAYREIMAANGHGGKEIWITEFGYATWDGFPGDPPPGSEWMRFTSACEQANYTIRALQILESDPNIGPVILWNLNFGRLPILVEQGDERIAYSLVMPEGQPERPLYWMLFDAMRGDLQLTDQCLGFTFEE
jgi:aryl-phospho-beta-D-glucosidase BglC (GH1 family)